MKVTTTKSFYKDGQIWNYSNGHVRACYGDKIKWFFSSVQQKKHRAKIWITKTMKQDLSNQTDIN
jgi:hypothetical protein